MSKPAKKKYRTKNWSPYTKALRARGSLTMWLDRDMYLFTPPPGIDNIVKPVKSG